MPDDRIECFWIEPTDRCKRWLRRYRPSSKPRNACPASPSYKTKPEFAYHQAMIAIEDGHARDLVNPLHNPPRHVLDMGPREIPRTDSRWPENCACSYVFAEDDEWQVFCRQIYRARDGREMTIEDAIPGAMWDATWLKGHYPEGADGRIIMVKMPGGSEWCIDSEASNCTRKGDRSHKCWVRHGDVPLLTVDKNGDTCAAGAGSIVVEGWHGFLRNGYLVRC